MIKLGLSDLAFQVEAGYHVAAGKVGGWINHSVRWLDVVSSHLQDWRLASGVIVISNIALFFMALKIARLVARYLENELPYGDLTESGRQSRGLGLMAVILASEISGNYVISKTFKLPISPWKTVLISSITNILCFVLKLKFKNVKTN